ncbi:low molecular weight phosphotyrosine protein phosphatase [Puniceicoccaceae bacterium K14]|nr:low molecular weight phosphotyrosine protein phosphatase [Puniceicoccaceae bacterium K14]
MKTTQLPKIKSILFVCWGNICRSPAAENVMRSLLEESELEDVIECGSAGTINSHAGNPPDPRMSVAGKRRGLPMTGSAQCITERDLDHYDLIITMDDFNMESVRDLDHSGITKNKLVPFCSFCQKHSDTEVPDPYYGGDAGFEHVLDLLEDGCSQIIEIIKSQQS